MRQNEHKGDKLTSSSEFLMISALMSDVQNVFKSPAGFCQSGRGSSGARKVLHGIGISLRGMAVPKNLGNSGMPEIK
jgi:hypothetical protein